MWQEALPPKHKIGQLFFAQKSRYQDDFFSPAPPPPPLATLVLCTPTRGPSSLINPPLVTILIRVLPMIT